MNATEYHASRARRDMPLDQLRASVVTKSVLMDWSPSPYSWRNGPEKQTTAAMVDGLLVDCLLTQPEQMAALFAVSPHESYRTGEAKAWRDAALASGRHVVTPDEVVGAKRSAAILQEEHSALLAGAEFQQPWITAASVDGTDIRVGCLPDILPAHPDWRDCIVDLKRTDDVTPSGFKRAAMRFGYDVQAALSLMIAQNAGIKRDRFLFLVQSRNEPYETALYQLEFNSLARANDWTGAQLVRWARCLRDDRWPKATEGIGLIELPPWSRKTDEPDLEDMQP